MAGPLSVPPPIQARVDELVAALRATLQDALAAVVAHGSAVRGGWLPQSDVDLIVVVTRDAPELLAAAGPALAVARAAARVEAMILRGDEIARAADVFPLLYDDVRRHHVVLHGADPFAGTVVHDRHRRVRIEQELRDARIRLRHLVATEGLGAALVGPLVRKVKQVRSPLHALLTMMGRAGGDDVAAVLSSSAAAFSVDTGPLGAIGGDPRAACVAFGALLDAAIAAVDARGDA